MIVCLWYFPQDWIILVCILRNLAEKSGLFKIQRHDDGVCVVSNHTYYVRKRQTSAWSS